MDEISGAKSQLFGGKSCVIPLTHLVERDSLGNEAHRYALWQFRPFRHTVVGNPA